MENKKEMSFASRGNSFSYAFSGLRQIFKQEPNARLHALATIVAIAAGIIRHISPAQWIALVFAIGLVWITEALNTCIEKLCDLWSGGKWYAEIEIIKDIAAGAVLIAAVISVVTGIIVFLF
jgi:diacylglycerol kinase (ATP)